MKKDLHDLIYNVWINHNQAMFTRDEPGQLHHEEKLYRGDNQDSNDWIKAVAHKIRYASEIHIKGSTAASEQLQAFLEADPHNTDFLITREESVF